MQVLCDEASSIIPPTSSPSLNALRDSLHVLTTFFPSLFIHFYFQFFFQKKFDFLFLFIFKYIFLIFFLQAQTLDPSLFHHYSNFLNWKSIKI